MTKVEEAVSWLSAEIGYASCAEPMTACIIATYVQSRVSPARYAAMRGEGAAPASGSSEALDAGAGLCDSQTDLFMVLAMQLGLTAIKRELRWRDDLGDLNNHFVAEVVDPKQGWWFAVDPTYAAVWPYERAAPWVLASLEEVVERDLRPRYNQHGAHALAQRVARMNPFAWAQNPSLEIVA